LTERFGRFGTFALRGVGVLVACVVYLMTGMASCAGHAGYFRDRLMYTAECEGTQLDFLVSALAVVVVWLCIRPEGKRFRVVLLVTLALWFLTMPACAAMVNCRTPR
jgi:hypothetical protein